MKRIFFLLLTIICITNGLKAQLSEKFLKLNRVVVLDSVKSKIFNTLGNSETIFSITVPVGVYWKIETINFNFLTNQNFIDGFEPRVKINSSVLTFTIGSGIYTTLGGFFSKTTPTWAGPGSTLTMYAINNYVYNSGKIANFDMSLSAMEFILE